LHNIFLYLYFIDKDHQNDYELPTLNTREAIAQFVRQEFQDIKQLNYKEAYTDSLADMYRPHFHIMRNYDYTCLF